MFKKQLFLFPSGKCERGIQPLQTLSSSVINEFVEVEKRVDNYIETTNTFINSSKKESRQTCPLLQQ